MTTDSNTEDSTAPVSPIEGLKAFARFYCRNAPWQVVQHGLHYTAIAEPKKGCKITYMVAYSSKRKSCGVTCSVSVLAPQGKPSKHYLLPLTLYTGEEAEKLFKDIEEQCSTFIANNILDQINKLP